MSEIVVTYGGVSTVVVVGGDPTVITVDAETTVVTVSAAPAPTILQILTQGAQYVLDTWSLGAPVTISGLSAGDMLEYNGVNWYNRREPHIRVSATAPVAPQVNDVWIDIT